MVLVVLAVLVVLLYASSCAGSDLLFGNTDDLIRQPHSVHPGHSRHKMFPPGHRGPRGETSDYSAPRGGQRHFLVRTDD